MKTNIYGVVVLYKTYYKESISILTLANSLKNANIDSFDLLIYDNSPSYNSSQTINTWNGINIEYIADYNNSGVSRAYNIAFEYAKKKQKEYLLLLDQDTKINSNFFSCLNQNLGRYDLYFPYLESNNTIISPCKFILGRGIPLNKRELQPGTNLLHRRNFLNSCAIISISLFEKVHGFDENIPLYYSDFNFFNRVKKNGIKHYYQLNISCTHEMASSDDSDISNFLPRFINYIQGAMKCYNSLGGKTMMAINIILRATKLGIRHRTLLFLKLSFNELLNLLFIK